jgi:hypothetical protein
MADTFEDKIKTVISNSKQMKNEPTTSVNYRFKELLKILRHSTPLGRQNFHNKKRSAS